MTVPMLRYVAVTKSEEDRPDKRRITVNVKDWNGRPAREAEVNLYEVRENQKLKTLAIGYTNREGEVSFNGLAKNKSYTLKIYYRGVKSEKIIGEEMESVIKEFDEYEKDTQEEEEE
ncbi:hypothetical protein [Clostridium thermarum]|uniref:hypothetical protein n=1 Tax=Clostridium thermarum TaxID=1716543 RepID=UPI0013D7FBF3|nr:hypothetical protein [Clostridium thermarum]